MKMVQRIYLDKTKKNESVSSTQSSGDLFIQGQKDALRFYKGYKGAGTGTLIAGLVSPLVGLIPAIACSSTEPKEINLNYPNADLMKNQIITTVTLRKQRKLNREKFGQTRE